MIFDAEREAKIDELHAWYQRHDSLPNEINRTLLKRFYQCMYGDMEQTKHLIEINYGLRNKYPDIFLKRDPADENSRKTFEYADMIPLPGLTPERYKLSCYRLCDFDAAKVRHTEDTKAFFLVADHRFSLPDILAGAGDACDILAEGEVQIFDMTGYTLKHLTKMNISTLRVYMKFLQLALPVRLKAIHIINCPSYLDKIVSVLKPFISAEVFQMIHFHTEGIDSLYNHVPRELLPTEYGGNAGKFCDLKTQIVRELRENRAYLTDSNHWKVTKTAASSRWNIF